MPRNPLAFDPAHPDARPASTTSGGLYGNALTRYIRRRAQQLGLDPLVPLAVAPHEGGFAGAVGDQGSSFGPFQLHVGGALPAAHVADARTWANSPAGVDYALGALAKTLGGRRGQAGVAAAVREFERPAAQYVPGEIGKATATYQQLATSAAPPSPAPPPVRTPQAGGWTTALRGGTRPQTGNWVDALSGTTTAAPTAATSKPASWVEALAGKTTPPPASEPGPLPLAQPRNAQTAPVKVDASRAGPVPPIGAKLVQTAERWLGTPYSWGGGSPSGPTFGVGRGARTKGFDCSSFAQYVAASAGVKIPRVTYDQWRDLKPIMGPLQEGDLVFFEPGSRGPEHVGMYIGNNQFIESPHTGATIRISQLGARKDYMGARRFLTA